MDIMTRRAAKMFGVKESEVTLEQRTAAKTVYFGHDYGLGQGTMEEFFAQEKLRPHVYPGDWPISPTGQCTTKEHEMFVFPMIDRESGEIILIYRNARKDGSKCWLDAEVYAFHGDAQSFATHFGVGELNREYLTKLSVPETRDEPRVQSAIEFYQMHIDRLPEPRTKIVRSKTVLPEYLEAKNT